MADKDLLLKLRHSWVKIDWIVDRRTWIMYLQVLEFRKDWGEIAKVKPNEKFFAMVSKHVDAYINGGVEPPAEIASAVMNIGDDVMAGRDIVLRAGDYIALQSFAMG